MTYFPYPFAFASPPVPAPAPHAPAIGDPTRGDPPLPGSAGPDQSAAATPPAAAPVGATISDPADHIVPAKPWRCVCGATATENNASTHRENCMDAKFHSAQLVPPIRERTLDELNAEIAAFEARHSTLFRQYEPVKPDPTVVAVP